MSTRFDELKITNQLPSPSGVALAVLRLGESDDASIAEITRVMQTDPALCGRLLKVANSAGMARGRAAASVGDAVNQLGTRMVRSIALGFSLVSQHRRGACRGFDYKRFWSHSLAMAISAQTAAKRLGKLPPHEAFTCGLLAQVGRLALACVFPDAYSDILAQVQAGNSTDLHQLESSHFAIDHHEMTGSLLRDWGLPDDWVVAAERFDHVNAPVVAMNERVIALTRLLRMSAQLANVCLASAGEFPEATRDLLAAGDDLGVKPSEIVGMCESVARDWCEWGAIFEIDTAAAPCFAELVERACAAEPMSQLIRPSDEVPADAPLRIVVVDDDPDALRLLTAQLVKAGHFVHGAATSAEGLRLILAVAPQMVITDFQMPGMDGAALIRAIRQTTMGRELYVIMLTDSDDDETHADALATGADDYLAKPVRAPALTARLRACARVVRLQDEVRREKDELRRCIADLGVANRKLQHAELMDGLTGLYNRRYALDRLEQEWSQSFRNGTPLACMIIDVDHIKRINDTYGHDVGDRVLQATAELLGLKMRQTDVVCRLSGDQFMVIGTNMDSQTSVTCAERLRSSVEAQIIETSDGRLQVTVTIGVAVRASWMKNLAELLKVADEAVDAAKAMGRNKVRIESTLTALPALFSREA
jgi:two-component system, cell cycle response regulator